MPEIKSITENTSMQPQTHYVGEPMMVIRDGKDVNKARVRGTAVVNRIVPEIVLINGNPFDYYVGYNIDNKRLFECRKGTVHVEYFVDE